MPPLIRLARPDDLSAINAIYNHYVTRSTCTYQLEPSTMQEREGWLQKHPAEFPATVAELPRGRGGAGGGMEIVGWASLSPFHARPGWRFTVENSVYIHPQHQRKGLGRVLMVDLMQRSDALGYRAIIAIISADQAASVALHAALGFVEVGRLRNVGFKFDRWLDVVYMQRSRSE